MTPELPRPRRWGRLVRLLASLTIAGLVSLTGPAELNDPDGLFWALAAYTLVWLLPDSFQALTGIRRKMTVGTCLVLAATAGAVSLAIHSTLWAPPLSWLLYLTTVLVLAGLSVSYLLAALIRTPGCERGALPHLVALLAGRSFEPRLCSLLLPGLDQWEARRAERMVASALQGDDS